MVPKNTSKICLQIFQTNANLSGLAINNNQSRTSSEHFDPPLFQNPHKIILNIVQDFNNRDIIDYLRGIAFNVAMWLLTSFETAFLKATNLTIGYTDLGTDSLKKYLEFEGRGFCI